MSTYRLFYRSSASASVEVEAESLDEAWDLAYEELPSDVCAMCAGMGIGSNYSLDIDGEWEPDESGYEVDGEYVTTEVPA